MDDLKPELIVSRMFPHAGGVCYVKITEPKTLVLVCSACAIAEVRMNMADALIALGEHHDADATPLPD